MKGYFGQETQRQLGFILTLVLLLYSEKLNCFTNKKASWQGDATEKSLIYEFFFIKLSYIWHTICRAAAAIDTISSLLL